jgi:hypothetical protein
MLDKATLIDSSNLIRFGQGGYVLSGDRNAYWFVISTSSTHRLFTRPTSVLLDATEAWEPLPKAITLEGAIPCLETSASTIACDYNRLIHMCPPWKSSVWS